MTVIQNRTTSLFVVGSQDNTSLFAAIEHAMHSAEEPLVNLPTLTNVALGDAYLARQLADLHAHFEIRPAPAQGLLARLRTRLAWWLLGAELQQSNQVHARLIRVLDSLIVHIDQERGARRRIEEHLATLNVDAETSSSDPSPEVLRPPPSLLYPLPSMLHVVWHSSFAAPTGYSSSARAFVLGLDACDVVVRPLYLYGTDHDEQILMGQMNPRIKQLQKLPVRLDVPQVVYAPGDRFTKNSGHYRIGFTMLEVDRLPDTWIEQANQMDEVWTPTIWGAQVFRDSGVKRPVHVIPLGVDTSRFRPGESRTHLPEHTIFLSVFEWGMRKGWDVLLRAYSAAFQHTDPVLLLLKVDCREPAVNPVRELARLLPGQAPPVGLLYNQTLTLAQLVELYQGSDCFVLPTHGEGWGMPVLEAMACGVPAIVTNWSGPTAFVNEDNGYPLPILGLTPTGSDIPYYRDALWATPDEHALVDLLRHVAAHPAERRRKGQQAAEDACSWTWAQAVDLVCQRLVTI